MLLLWYKLPPEPVGNMIVRYEETMDTDFVGECFGRIDFLDER